MVLCYQYRAELADNLRIHHLKRMMGILIEQSADSWQEQRSFRVCFEITDVEWAATSDYEERAITMTLTMEEHPTNAVDETRSDKDCLYPDAAGAD